LLDDDSVNRVEDTLYSVGSPSASDDFNYAETMKQMVGNAISDIELKQDLDSIILSLKHLHDFWCLPSWSLELAQDMSDVYMARDEVLQSKLWKVWEMIQSTHLVYIDYLKERSRFWFNETPGLEAKLRESDWQKDLTKEGIEPNPGPPKQQRKQPASGMKQGKGLSKQPSRITGKGDYKSTINGWLKKGGAKLGEMAGSAVSRIFGFGDYTVSKNSLLNGAPVFDAKRVERISRRVYIGEVSSSIVFTTQYYISLNPAMGQFDPQLRLESWNYEEYDINGMIFYFRSLSATAVASTNTALGAIMMATNYDSNADQFTSKLAMENHLFSTSAAPCNDSVHAVECDRKQSVLSKLYLRRSDHQKIVGTGNGLTTTDQGNIPAIITDYHTYDFGDFQLSSQGSQAIASVGELWCSYDVSLFKHKLLSSPAVMEYMTLSLFGPALCTQISNPFGVSDSEFKTNSCLDLRSTLVPRYVDQNSINLGRLGPGCYLVTFDLNWANASAGNAYIWPQISVSPSPSDVAGPVRVNNIFLGGVAYQRASPQSFLDGVVTAIAQTSFIVLPDVSWAAYPLGVTINITYNTGNAASVASQCSVTLVGMSNVTNP
jgi:hypothetical protein